jgi:hypothetical protein
MLRVFFFERRSPLACSAPAHSLAADMTEMGSCLQGNVIL